MYTGFEKSRAITYSEGILFILSEHGLSYIDHKGVIKVHTQGMVRNTAEEFVKEHKIIQGERVSQLRLVDLRKYIKDWVSEHKPKDTIVDLDVLVEKGTAITAITRELVYFAAIGKNTVKEVALNMTPTHLTATVLRQLDLPSTIQMTEIEFENVQENNTNVNENFEEEVSEDAYVKALMGA